MAQWILNFEKVLKHMMPTKADINMNAYNYRIDTMGVEREQKGFEQISVCVDALYTSGFDVFEKALKLAGKYLVDMMPNENPYKLFGIVEDSSFAYIARATYVNHLKAKYIRGFEDNGIIRKKGFDVFAPKKLSLCILITDREDFSLPDETVTQLKRKYKKIILLDFSAEKVVTPIK